MQRYRLGTVLCDTAGMPHNTIPTPFPIRSHFTPLHSLDSLDSPDSLIFFLTETGPACRMRRGIYLERL